MQLQVLGSHSTFTVVTGSSIATIFSGNKVAFTGTGSVTVRASQAGDATYAAAPSIERTFAVKRPLSLTFDPIGPKGANQQFTANAVVRDGISGAPLTGANAPTPNYSIVSDQLR